MWWLFVIIGIIALLILVFLLMDFPNRKEIKNLSFDNQVFADLQDGVYQGEFVGEKGHMRNRQGRQRDQTYERFYHIRFI